MGVLCRRHSDFEDLHHQPSRRAQAGADANFSIFVSGVSLSFLDQPSHCLAHGMELLPMAFFFFLFLLKTVAVCLILLLIRFIQSASHV